MTSRNSQTLHGRRFQHKIQRLLPDRNRLGTNKQEISRNNSRRYISSRKCGQLNIVSKLTLSYVLLMHLMRLQCKKPTSFSIAISAHGSKKKYRVQVQLHRLSCGLGLGSLPLPSDNFLSNEGTPYSAHYGIHLSGQGLSYNSSTLLRCEVIIIAHITYRYRTST